MYRNRKPDKHAFQVFAEDIKAEKTGNVILMFGIEQYLVKWAVESLVKKYVNPATASMDYAVLDDENSSCDQIIEACETFSMFSAKRIVWVRNFKPLKSDSPRGYQKKDVENLAEYLKISNEGTVLIFSGEEVETKTIMYQSLQKYGKVYEFNQLGKGELSSFARKRFRAAGIDISPRMLSVLIDATGYNNKESDYRLFNFENDINKIIAISNRETITESDIFQAVNGDMDTFVFDMLDGIVGGQKDKAFYIMYNILHSGQDPFTLIGAIASQFELMLSIKQLREDGCDLKAIHGQLGGSEYRIKKLIPYTNRYSVDKLKKTLSNIYEVDRNIKTGLLSDRMALELFIAGI